MSAPPIGLMIENSDGKASRNATSPAGAALRQSAIIGFVPGPSSSNQPYITDGGGPPQRRGGVSASIPAPGPHADIRREQLNVGRFSEADARSRREAAIGDRDGGRRSWGSGHRPPVFWTR